MKRPERPDVEAAEKRILQSLRSKRTGAHRYWNERGRRRFEAELAADSIAPEAAADLLDRIERDLFPPVDLDEVLRQVRERVARERG